MALIDIVTQNEGGSLPGNEVGAHDTGLRQPVGAGLFGIFEGHAPLRPVTQQRLKSGQIAGRGYDQRLPDPSQHHGAERVIDHRLVIDRHKLLRGRQRHGIEAGAATVGQNQHV